MLVGHGLGSSEIKLTTTPKSCVRPEVLNHYNILILLIWEAHCVLKHLQTIQTHSDLRSFPILAGYQILACQAITETTPFQQTMCT